MNKTFDAKLEIYTDRINYLLPNGSEVMGALIVKEFDRRQKRLVIEPTGHGRRTGTAKGAWRRYQYTVANPKKYVGTYRLRGRVDGHQIILEPPAFKSPAEVFGA